MLFVCSPEQFLFTRYTLNKNPKTTFVFRKLYRLQETPRKSGATLLNRQNENRGENLLRPSPLLLLVLVSGKKFERWAMEHKQSFFTPFQSPTLTNYYLRPLGYCRNSRGKLRTSFKCKSDRFYRHYWSSSEDDLEKHCNANLTLIYLKNVVSKTRLAAAGPYEIYIKMLQTAPPSILAEVLKLFNHA